MADQVILMPEVEVEVKKPRLFVCAPSTDDIWAYTADLADGAHLVNESLAELTYSTIESFINCGDTEATIELRVRLMTDAEVAALPEM